MRKYWIQRLPGMPELPSYTNGYSRPDRVTATFIEEGYFVEYFEYPFDRDRTVALFFGPKEFVMRCHPVFSKIQALAPASTADFSYSNIFRTLRNFPEAGSHYKKVKDLYEQKVSDRLKLSRLNSDKARFRFVHERQAWVLSKVPENLVAGYLGVTVERLRELKRG